MTPEVFEGQMAYLAKSGYKALSLDELLALIKGENNLRQKAVVIIFDEGWLDNYIYAFPVLEKYGLHASLFVVTDWIERSSEKFNGIPTFVLTNEESKALVKNREEQKVILTWDIIRKMLDSGLISFYSHTKTHQGCNNLSEPHLKEEFIGSRRVLEEQLGRTCPYLCWPYGVSSDAAILIG